MVFGTSNNFNFQVAVRRFPKFVLTQDSCRFCPTRRSNEFSVRYEMYMRSCCESIEHGQTKWSTKLLIVLSHQHSHQLCCIVGRYLYRRTPFYERIQHPDVDGSDRFHANVVLVVRPPRRRLRFRFPVHIRFEFWLVWYPERQHRHPGAGFGVQTCFQLQSVYRL